MTNKKMKFVQILFSSLVIAGVFGSDNEWWKHANIYEIYLRSFKDSDGDGIGDIKGLIFKLDYLVDIGVDTVYLTPFYPSSMADGGYDITDYKGIDSVYGTMQDFEELMKEMNAKGLHLVIDLVINHSSDEHEWFQKSINKIAPYSDYYIWANPKGNDWNGKPIPPNNWFSLGSIHDSGSAWTWNENRKQFYLHQMITKQPDLNLRNEDVKAEIKNIMKFWLEKGVSGFRVDAPMMFMEDEQLRDNPTVPPDANMFTVFSFCEYTYNHPDTFRFIGELNVFLQQFDRKSRRKNQTVFIGETYGSMETVIKYYGTKRYPLFNLPLNYFSVELLGRYLDAHQLHNNLQTWLDKVPKNMQSSWALGNHDFGRVAHYFTSEYNSILLALVTMLPGASVIYYGEELTMGANKLVPNNDPYMRSPFRSPMHWDDTRNSGFTSGGNAWLPVHPNYWHSNVQTQKTYENSSLNYFKDLTSLRKTDTLKYGDLKFHIVSKWVMAYSRTYKGTSYIIVMNLGTETQPIDLYDVVNNISTILTVVACSPNSGYKKGYEMKTTPNYPTASLLRPHSVVVLSSK
ncbi:probable maltase [Planococcus citri]|uniref:probable maltase n=1 Tax=Planococcus citri TaxID=170843 RepID=UPI0031F8297F